jgi:hypothetical protein
MRKRGMPPILISEPQYSSNHKVVAGHHTSDYATGPYAFAVFVRTPS